MCVYVTLRVWNIDSVELTMCMDTYTDTCVFCDCKYPLSLSLSLSLSIEFFLGLLSFWCNLLTYGVILIIVKAVQYHLYRQTLN